MKLSKATFHRHVLQTQEDPGRQQSQSNLNGAVLTKFITYMTQLRNNQLREGVKNIYGRHYPVNFNPKYLFKEQWQSKIKPNQQNNTSEIMQTELSSAYIYSIIFLIAQVSLVWYLSTFRLIELIKQQATVIILAISMVTTVVDCIVKFFIRFSHGSNILDWKDVILSFKDSQALFLYYLFNLVLVKLEIYETSNPFMYLLDMVAIRLLYMRTQRLFQHFKIRSYTTAYKHYFKILDLASNILSIQHVFALFIFLMSFYNQENNWLSHYGHEGAINIQRYYYSFYFTSTTIFTIGYGDIVPVNNVQMFCVLIMQILGIAFFSYLINQIGYTLSAMKKQEEELEHNISTLSKMCKYYKIDADLANIAKDYLLNNQKSFHDIQPQEEKQVLMKLNENLRQALTYQNSLNIVKSSLFFICHWTKLFQTEIAKRLIKKILIPNEMIIQVSGKQNIYIIKSGKLQVYTNNCFGFRKSFKKLLKTIQPNDKNQISDNIYGYTSIISSKQVKLNAISKDFTCVYYIDKNNFMQCVHQNKLDTEYYFEIKANLDQTKYVEAYEAPAILNIRQHYRPSETFIIKKNVQRMKKYRNSRREFLRYDRQKGVASNIVVNYREGDFDRIPSTSKEIRLTICDVRSSNTHQQNRSSQLDLLPNPMAITKEDTMNKETIITSYFEMMKDYQKYFKRFNMWNILLKLEKQNLADYPEAVEDVRYQLCCTMKRKNMTFKKHS